MSLFSKLLIIIENISWVNESWLISSVPFSVITPFFTYCLLLSLVIGYKKHTESFFWEKNGENFF